MSRYRFDAWLVAVCLLLIYAAPLQAWTTPVSLSDLVRDVQWPRLCASANGGMHLIYRLRFRPWLIAYRFRDPGGNWGPIEYPVTMSFQDTPWIVEDAQGRPHIFFAGGPDGNWPEHWTQIYEAIRQNGVWAIHQVTPAEDIHQGYPRVAIDHQNRYHLLYLKVDLNHSVRPDVKYRSSADDVSWSAETDLGRVDNFYYQHPHMVCDPADRIHATWVDLGSPRDQLIYRRLVNGAWSPQVTVGASIGSSYVTFPKIVVTGNNTVLATANDDGAGSTAWIKGAMSTDGGATWGSFNNIAQGTSVSTAADASGGIRMAYAWPGELITGYTQWAGSWAAPQQITSSTAWQLSQDIAVDTAGMVHVAFENNINNNNIHVISYMNNQTVATPTPSGNIAGTVRDQNGLALANVGISTSNAAAGTTGASGGYLLSTAAGANTVTATRLGYGSLTLPNISVTPNQTTTGVDFTLTGQPPAAASSFSVASGNTINTLTWVHPASPQLNGIRMVFRTEAPPANPNDGTVLLDSMAQPNETRTLQHAGLADGTRYYYAIYLYFQDASRFYSSDVQASGTPFARPDFDHDGDVDQSDFGHIQICMTAQGVVPTNACQDASLDNDGDVDAADLTILLNCFRGPKTSYDPACSN